MTRIKLSAPRLHLPFSMLFNQDKHICLYRLELFNCISWSVHLFFCWGRRKEKGQDGAARGEGGWGGGVVVCGKGGFKINQSLSSSLGLPSSCMEFSFAFWFAHTCLKCAKLSIQFQIEHFLHTDSTIYRLNPILILIIIAFVDH